MEKPATKASRKAAESLAIQALSFIAADPERLGRFLAATGIGPGDIRAAAREPLFLAGVLDHIASDESLLTGFAADANANPREVERAQTTLSGRRYERDMP
jgi:hypothetical protein